MNSGLPNRIINEFQHPDGRKGYYEVNVYPNAIGILCVARDVTEHKRTEEALRESEERFRGVFATSPIGIVLVDSETQGFFEANKSFLEITGYSADELKGLTVEDITVADDWEMEKDLINDYIAERLDRYEVVKRYISKNGEIKYVQVNGDLLPRNAEAPLAIANVLDITQRMQAEQEKEEIRTRLQQARKMETLGTLAGGMAHEFNNLLQAISGHTQLLLIDTGPADPEYSNLIAIHKAGNRGAELVRQLLQFSRKANDARRPINFSNVMEQAQQILDRTIPKMIRIQITTKDRLWAVNADPVQVEQILLNLASNAADAMPDGGSLNYTIENKTLDNDNFDQHVGAPPGRYVLLTVSDTGHGMDKETMEKIFDPFFTTKEIGKGTGLGLASIHGIVKSHGGHITCYSAVGRGTTFKLYFPAIEEPEDRKIKETGPEALPHGQETILLVDDEDAVRGFAAQALTKFGYSVVTASSGEEALEIYFARSNKFDLIVMDLGMPGMGGHKCLVELLRLDSEVRVIIASGYSINGPIKKSIEAGARGYVAKPYELADLLTTVRSALDEKE